MPIKLSLVELGAVGYGRTRSDAIKDIIETAQKIEEWGYNRIWLAEHHNTANMISRAPEVLIPMVASNTSRIRVGSGSVLLNHYSPFKVAEVFTLLGDMFPGRIDMGIGRATTGPVSDYALQRNRSILQNNEDSEEQLKELLNWLTDGFSARSVFSQIKAHHDGPNLPEFWLLGSSQWSAYTAGSLGLNYSFAGFINPDQAYHITNKYRDNFTPAAHRLGASRPRLMLSLSIYCADTLEDAGKLAVCGCAAGDAAGRADHRHAPRSRGGGLVLLQAAVLPAAAFLLRPGRHRRAGHLPGPGRPALPARHPRRPHPVQRRPRRRVPRAPAPVTAVSARACGASLRGAAGETRSESAAARQMTPAARSDSISALV